MNAMTTLMIARKLRPDPEEPKKSTTKKTKGGKK